MAYFERRSCPLPTHIVLSQLGCSRKAHHATTGPGVISVTRHLRHARDGDDGGGDYSFLQNDNKLTMKMNCVNYVKSPYNH